MKSGFEIPWNLGERDEVIVTPRRGVYVCGGYGRVLAGGNKLKVVAGSAGKGGKGRPFLLTCAPLAAP